VSSLSEFTPKYLRLQPAANDDDAVIVSVGIELLTEDVNLEQFGHELFALVEQFGCRRLVVNLQEVRVVTSAGLGKMITLHRKMHRHEGHVIFCHVQKDVDEVLKTSRLNTYLTIAVDIDAALAALPALPKR
jgi:anti-sigma B factor antagonist